MAKNILNNYYIKRIFQSILTIFSVVTISYVLMRLIPGGPTDYLMAELRRQNPNLNEHEVRQRVESVTRIDPDQTVLEGYINYMSSLLSGDFGQSMWYSSPVTELIANALPWTIFVISIATILTFGIGILVGAAMAYFEGSKEDVGLTIILMFFNSVPFYLLAVVLLIIFSYRIQLFPSGQAHSVTVTPGFNARFIIDVIYHAALPIISVVITEIGGAAIAMRSNSISVLGEDYLRVARIRGLPNDRIATRYVTRNAILPMYTSLMISIGFLFGGSVFLEQIFSYPGVGNLMFQAISARDYPLVMGILIILTTMVVISILIADLTYGKLDPRASRGGQNGY